MLSVTLVDKFIEEKRLKWIPYNQFKNVKYLDKGGFSTIYKAIWLTEHKEVVLKCLNNLNKNNLNENLDDFLNEWDCHEKCLDSTKIINLHGFTKNQDASNYMVVIDYANKGNLRENLTKVIDNNWNQRLFMLCEIISGLNVIHEQNLIHCDFHDGNILLNYEETRVFISDLGLCQPVKSFLKKYDIYGVIPFMAPEILRGNPYTPASDIYSFSMIMWEFTSGVPPFNDKAHDLQLALSICKEVENIIRNWIYRPSDGEISEELKSNIMEFINAPIIYNNLTINPHPQACYTSRLLDFTSKKLFEILESECLDCLINDIKSLETNEN
ncbi:hypothetical protein RclHR1_10050009 [Rhizophagus clarus]|uniref:Protein kinase domain-containing protein n=1 Tax=Rhizophagus clarus TaxID=94130 RepID=A0A2Z6QSP5_9GLOM|nr:hypothetical protein RclHR1_10050009 [Rhizophagus clarus]